MATAGTTSTDGASGCSTMSRRWKGKKPIEERKCCALMLKEPLGGKLHRAAFALGGVFRAAGAEELTLRQSALKKTSRVLGGRRHRSQEFGVGFGFGQAAEQQLHRFHRRQRT